VSNMIRAGKESERRRPRKMSFTAVVQDRDIEYDASVSSPAILLKRDWIQVERSNSVKAPGR
jgi:hypothetical protein